jgi:hypothetical protein
MVDAIVERRAAEPALARHAVCAFEGRRMKVNFRITSALLATVRIDLSRPHAFAHERVGFISAGLAATHDDLIAIAREYRPVADEDYLRDNSVGAMMGPDAIRKALQWAMDSGAALFHVHTHGGNGVPGFSGVDIRENAKFVPDFFKVTPQMPHGSIVLSDNAARGQVWVERKGQPLTIDTYTEVGMPTQTWRAA